MKKLLSHPSSTRGYMIAIVGVAIWSTTAIFIRYLNDAFDMPPMAIAFWRDFFVALALFVIFLISKRELLNLRLNHWRFFLGYGLTLAIFNSLWTISVKMNGAAIATVLIYSSAAFTALYERWFLKERLGWWKVLVIFLSLLGCMLVSGVYDPVTWQLNLWGIVIGLFSGVGFTAYSLLGKKSTCKGINSWTALMYSFAVASLFLLIFNLFPDPTSNVTVTERLFWLEDSLMGWGVLFLLAIGPSIGGYGLYTFSLSFLSASIANLIATLEPSMTALLAYFLLGERFNWYQIVGSILILAGVMILRLHEQLTVRKETRV